MSKQFLPITDFARSGLNSDILPWDMPPSFLTDIRNVRIVANRLTPFIGGQKWFLLPPGYEPGFIMYTGSEDNRFWIIAGLADPSGEFIYAFDGVTLVDKTVAPLPFVTIENKGEFTGCLLSRIPIINHPTDYPIYWADPSLGNPFFDLPFTDTTTWREEDQQCRVIRSHKQFLFALDITTPTAGRIPDGVRWSAPADVNSVPETWAELDQTNVAGLVQLGGDGGDIIDGLSLRDAFCVYRQRSISIFDFVDIPFVWQIRHLSTTTGLLSSDAIVEVDGRHFFIGDGDIYVNDGNSITSIIHDKIKVRFNQDLNKDYFQNCYAIKNNVTSEIWFCIPGGEHTYPSLAYVYNWRDDSWSVFELGGFADAAPDGFGHQIPGMSYGSEEVSGATWDADLVITWPEKGNESWNSDSSSPFDNRLIGVQGPSDQSNLGNALIMRMDVKNQADRPPETKPIAERIGFPLHGINQVTTITRIFPHSDGPGKFYIRVGSQQYPGDAVAWSDPFLFDPNTMKKWDIRTTGELHSFQFTAEKDNVTWALSGIDVEYVIAGER